MHTVNSERVVARARKTPPATAQASAWWKLGAGTVVITAEGTAAYVQPALGAALAVADVTVPLAVALLLVAAVLCGSNETCERVFRLLRWIANRPEPPAPGRREP
jgi:hypothetical protein